MEWINTNDRMPEEGKWVIAKHSKGTWCDSEDPSGVNTVIVKLVRGLSKHDRQLMKEGLIPDIPEPSWGLRSNTYKFGDEEHNNLVPYEWTSFGATTFFGQDIYCWMPIPPEK